MALNDYYMTFEDVLAGLDEKDPWPTKEDLQPGKIYIDQKAFSDIQGFIQEHRYCLLEGAERRGKTTLARFTGLTYIEDIEDWHVRQVDVSRVANTSDLNYFIAILEQSLDIPKVLIIIEDCHTKPEITRAILKEAEKCSNASFLFTIRTVKQKKHIDIDEPFEASIIREQGWVVCLDGNEEIIYNNIQGIVGKFCEIHSSDLEYKSTEVMPSSYDYQYLAEQTGGNKRILEYYLDTWSGLKDPNLTLQRVDRTLILKQFHKERLQGLNDVQIEVLLTMSTLGQFEVPIFIKPLFPSVVSPLDFDRAADELSVLKGLAFRLPQGAWLLADTESSLTLECMTYLKRIGDSFVYDVLRTYAKKAANYFEVFHALHRAQKRPMLISLAEDAEVYNSLVRRFGEPNTSLSEMLYVLRAINWAKKDKAFELWLEYRKLLGKSYFDEIRRKLVETRDSRSTKMLLHFLSNIDKEGEAIPLAKALPTEFLISQARLEVAAFSSTVSMLDMLHSVAPKKAKQVLNGLNESDYRKLGEKARYKNPHSIAWFFRFLNYKELEDAAKAFVMGIGSEVLSEIVRSSSFGATCRIFRTFETTSPENFQQIINRFNESDYRKFGEKARYSSLQSVTWFLDWLTTDEKLKKFADRFLNAIGQDALTKMASSSSIGNIKKYRKTLGRLNTDTAKEIRNNLKPQITDEEWIEKWTNETIGLQSRQLWRWTRSLAPGLRERGKKLAKRLADADIALHFEETEEASPVEHLGKLLISTYYLDEEAAKLLALKVVEVFDAKSMRYSLEQLVHLLRNCSRCNPSASRHLVEKIFSTNDPDLLSKGEPDLFCQLLWESVICNESRTKEWITEVSESLWEDLVAKASPANAFRLLLNLWQANDELGIKVAQAIGQWQFTSPELRDDPQAMPLLGFFAFCGFEPLGALSFSPVESVSKLYVYPTNPRLACSLFYLQQSDPEVIPGFVQSMLTLKGVIPEIAPLLAENPLPWTASALADILASVRSESRKEREDVYDRMLLLLLTIRRKVVYLNTLLNEMCSPPFAWQSEPTLETEGGIEREEQKTRSWATIWLGKALDKGIFTVQETKHPITQRVSRLLNLNRDHPRVTFALDITRDLLLALHDAQRGNEWADGKAWDTALFKGRWKGEALSPQQLRYWKGILLKMNTVKVDYQQTDDDRWIIAFCVNGDHPLAKSLVVKS